MPLPFMGGGDGLASLPDAISADWTLSSDGPSDTDQSTDDVEITFNVGATRLLRATTTVSVGGGGTLYYRLDSGSWVAYSVPFAVATGQDVGWRLVFAGSGTEVRQFNIVDDARGDVLDTISGSCVAT